VKNRKPDLEEMKRQREIKKAYKELQCFFHFSPPLSSSVSLLRSCPLIPNPIPSSSLFPVDYRRISDRDLRFINNYRKK
jgi:hypothetical protein